MRKRLAVKALRKYLLPGVKSADIFAILEETAIAILREKWISRKYSVRNQKDVIEYFRHSLIDKKREEIHVIFIDAKNMVIKSTKVGEGTLTQSIVYPREIIREAINVGALSFVLIHNHPSESPAPSEADRKITRKLLYAAKAMDLNMLDHIIACADGYWSFYEQGIIEKYNSEYSGFMENKL